MLQLQVIPKTDKRLRVDMSNHYSQPKGFVGRSICCAVTWNGAYYGSIVAGSAIMHLNGRDNFFNLSKESKKHSIQNIVNNIFFHVQPINCKYPTRNFTLKVLRAFRLKVIQDWKAKYDSVVIGFESLVELPRTGEVYRRDGWTEVGRTIGYTCKRTAGKGTDTWTGKRVWNVKDLKPKRVFCKSVE